MLATAAADDTANEEECQCGQRCPDRDPAAPAMPKPRKTTLPVMFATKTWPRLR